VISAWDFAVAAWRRPGLEAICLELQDDHGQHPGLLLWRSWTQAEGLTVDAESLARAIQTARGWENAVLEPLRTVRRRLGVVNGSLSPMAQPVVREAILAAELAAERALLEALQTLTTDRGDTSGETLTLLVDLAEMWRPPAPMLLLARLSNALAGAAG
jgi:uncharacterized protein (TIGR02444 family)